MNGSSQATLHMNNPQHYFFNLLLFFKLTALSDVIIIENIIMSGFNDLGVFLSPKDLKEIK